MLFPVQYFLACLESSLVDVYNEKHPWTKDVCVRRAKVSDGAFMSEAISTAVNDIVCHCYRC